MEWVEVEGQTVDEAVKMAMTELGIADRNDADVEIIQDAKPGFLGMGGRAAIVKVTKAAQQPKRRSRGRGRSENKNKGGSGQSSSSDGRSQQNRGGQQSGGGSRNGGGQQRSSDRDSSRKGGGKPKGEKKNVQRDDRPDPAPIEEQAKVAAAFLTGLLEAFGLEGSVETRIEDEVLYLDVSGEQTEALVGGKGSVMYSVLELTRTVVQRKTYGAPRMRIDINGYAERRREALKIYTRRLAEQVIEDKDEVMLEPMNAADRKVVHDTVAEIDSIRSFSEGEDPRRAVVIAFDGS